LQPYWLLLTKTYRCNLQYRMAHLVNTLGSALFGYINIYIWVAAAGPTGQVGNYSVQQLVLWAAFGQVMYNFVHWTTGLNIQLAVRSGDVSLELMRPVDFFSYVISRQAGENLYGLVYRSAPLYLLYAVTVGYRIPPLPSLLLLIPSLALALYVALCLGYLEGLSSFWTTDIRWISYFNMVFLTGASGIQVPVNLLPGFFGRVLPYAPWSALAHYPNYIYLGLQGWEALLIPALWAALLTCICRGLTNKARRHLEVQGG
jgi:ABC-2 type transport system permease protein